MVFFRFLSPMTSCFLRPMRILIMLLGGAVAAAFAQPDSSKIDPTRADANRSDYVLQPLDKVRIQVLREDELTRELSISQESTITLPHIGTIDLKSKTIRQAEENIRALYDRDYLVNPQVTVTVIEYSKKTVNVLGAVNTPGVIIFPQEQGLTLIDAITRAGGFSRVANKKKVTLKRTNTDGTVSTELINTEELTKGKSTDTWPLQPGDVIVVPEIII
jgi:polysaccharide biosynthesis/export protein